MDTLTTEQAKKLVKDRGGKRAAAKAAGMPYSSFINRLNGSKPRHLWLATVRKTAPDKPATSATRSAKSLSDFRAAYDKDFIIPRKIKAALATLGKTGWEYEAEFVKLAGVSFIDLGHYRDQFSEYIVVVNRESKRAWAGSVALASQMREMLA